MKSIIKISALPLILILASLACNAPTNVSGTPAAISTLNALYTAAAQTVQVASTPATPTVTATSAFPIYPSSTAAIATNTSAPVVLCDAAAFVKDVTVPDGTSFNRNVNFTKTWRIQNVGVCSWTTAYALVFVGGDGLSAPMAVGMPGVVNPGQVVDLSVNMTSPSGNGSYVGYWKLRNASGVLFGIGGAASGAFWVSINVNGPIYTAYDFAASYCDANWDNNDGDLPCPGSIGDDRGYVVNLSNPVMESGKTENTPGLLTVPKNAAYGFIQGKFPGVNIQNGDIFRARVNCQYQAYSCDIFFRLDYQVSGGPVYTLGQWHEVYEGKYTPISIDLSSLAGQKVRFILVVTANGSPYQDYGLWVAPQIIRQGVPSPTPTWTVTPSFTPTLTPTATFTATPTFTSTPTSSPTP